MFALDYTHEGMLIAMIEHPPAFGMKLKSFDAAETLKMPGIKDVFTVQMYEDGFEQGGFDTRTFNDLLVVVGNTTWEVMNARKKLKVQWEPTGDTKEYRWRKRWKKRNHYSRRTGKYQYPVGKNG